MASFLLEALKGVQEELRTRESVPERLAHLPTVLSILAGELAAIFKLVPYALTTMQLYRSLPTPERVLQAGPAAARLGVAVQRGVQYGSGPRCVLDVYLPVQAVPVQPGPGRQYGIGQQRVDGQEQQRQEQQQDCEGAGGERYPVVLFVHGGIWASGERWHYAPLAVRIAQDGFVVVVPTYEVFPKALAPQMVREVSDSLGWCQDNIAAYGGDAERIAVVGHSAGGHLASMALLCRASAAAAAASPSASAAAAEATAEASAAAAAAASPAAAAKARALGDAEPSSLHTFMGVTDGRMPALFVGLSGVFDIAKHYLFEAARGVNEMSMMKRAMGGEQGFASLSPTAILWGAGGRGQPGVQTGAEAPSLIGEAIPLRAGLVPDKVPAVEAGTEAQQPAEASPHCGCAPASSTAGCPAVRRPRAAPSLLWRALPPVVIQSSCFDIMVPWHEGAEFVAAVHHVGGLARHLIYNHASHQDFVMAWRPLSGAQVRTALSGESASARGDPPMRDFARDLLKVLHGMPWHPPAVAAQAELAGVPVAHRSRL